MENIKYFYNKLDNNYTQIEVEKDGTNKKRSFLVPNKNIDKFTSKYTKMNKQNNIITNTGFATSILGGVFLTSAITAKTIKSKSLKWIINTCGGIIGATASFIGIGNYLDKKEKKLLKQNNVFEIKTN